jgi:unsaturated rhamnogalacturonyl hydrolase
VKKILLISIALLVSLSMFPKKMSTLMAESEMTRFPELWQFDYGKRLYFGYTQGLGGTAFLKMWKATGEQKYYDYVQKWGDNIVDNNGNILLYKMEDYNLDFINSGKVLLGLYNETHEMKYRVAMYSLLMQFEKHPRTSDGGFWHKKRYEHQMWLDGLYMASPFLAEYGVTFGKPELIEETINQLLLVAKHTYDEKTGLFYHAWDESRTQKWADKVNGKSPNFWGRSIGWYAMALVDDLDYIQPGNPRRAKVLAIVNKLADGMLKYQDKKTGLWYQVVDQGGREGNYQEASV